MELCDLAPGQRARITDMNKLTHQVRRKLILMGLLPHSEVQFLRSAPLGDPLQIQCEGICLSMQKSLAKLIEVEPV